MATSMEFVVTRTVMTCLEFVVTMCRLTKQNWSMW